MNLSKIFSFVELLQSLSDSNTTTDPQGYCKNSKHTTYMEMKCQASCGLCLKLNLCIDQTNKCSYWAKQGYCDGGKYAEYMTTNCELSCGLCGGKPCSDEQEECALWEYAGECDTNADFMRDNCRNTCGLCNDRD